VRFFRQQILAECRIQERQTLVDRGDTRLGLNIELRAEAALPAPRERMSVAEDVLSAAKSVFHAVLPR